MTARSDSTDWILLGGEWSRRYRGERISVLPSIDARGWWAAYLGPVRIDGGDLPTLRAAKRAAERAAVQRAEALDARGGVASDRAD